MDTTRRRDFLRAIGVAGGVGFAGCQESSSDGRSQTPRRTPTSEHTRGAQTTEPTETAEPTETEEPADDPSETERLVGAHYYPWYEMHGGHRNWTDRTPSTPALDEYGATDPDVIDRHLTWCLEYGIDWLSVSWWGPKSGTDVALDEAVVEANQFDDVAFSILYETVGRLEEFDYDLDDPAARERLRDDLRYIDETYVHRENYLHLDDRPVVFFYVANLLRGDLEAAFEAITGDIGVDPYVLADVPFGTPPDTYPVTRVADAITTYNPYAARPDIESVFHELYDRGNKVMHLGAETANVGFIPTVIPGYDDTEIPDYQRADNPVLSPSPERYERVCEQVTPHLADAKAVLVTSFNEWYEDTQVEPSETYATAYLEVTAEKLAAGSSPGFGADGTVMGFVFDQTIIPAEVEPSSTDTRELAFMAGGLQLFDGTEPVHSYDIGAPSNEPLFLGGVYGTESDGNRTWRWFGGHTARTTLYVEADISNVDRAVLHGVPMRSNQIEADVYVDGTRTDHVAFRDRSETFDEYEISLTVTSS